VAESEAAVWLQNEVLECLWSQEATGTAWIGLEQNFIDTAVKWIEKASLCLCSHSGPTLKQFYYSQLKNVQLDELSAKVSEMWTKCVFTRYVN